MDYGAQKANAEIQMEWHKHANTLAQFQFGIFNNANFQESLMLCTFHLNHASAIPTALYTISHEYVFVAAVFANRVVRFDI